MKRRAIWASNPKLRLISTCNFKESSIMMWYGFTESSYIWRDLLKKQWNLGFREGHKMSWLADWLLAFQEGLFCMKLILLYSPVTRPNADTMWNRMNCGAQIYGSWRPVPHGNRSATRITLIISELSLLRMRITAITEWALTFSRYWAWILLSSGFDVVYFYVHLLYFMCICCTRCICCTLMCICCTLYVFVVLLMCICCTMCVLLFLL